jgi:hypothetical protein
MLTYAGIYKLSTRSGQKLGYPWYMRDIVERAPVITQGRRNELQSVASESRDLVARRRRRREFKDKVGESEGGLGQQVVEGLWEMAETDREFPELYKAGTQFNCFTGTNVQILTLRAASQSATM